MTREEALDILWKNRETIFNYKMEQVDEYTSIGLVTRSDEGRQYSLALELINKIYDEKEALEAQLKAKDDEIDKLKTIIEEAIMKPMGVEPHSWSDYKIQKANA